ncbi:hypothetical protein A3Q56_05759 [Intoshia linei]|uniref:Carboxylesterase type B domain-containing protein n=1 Tax=Intoshia linei TaxID=1819745 RepID=A0A177AYC2_9BILA|nr:hypothetical protein A3Q56_05759 [Intoshia linei]
MTRLINFDKNLPMNIYYTYILFILVILIQINSQNVNVNLDDVLYTNIDQSTVYQEKWDHYDNSVVVSTVFGEIVGFSIAANRSDLQSQCKEVPCWALKRINVFLGIPYAQPPVGNLRFRLPKWTDLPINATSYKPDCPQIRMGKLKYLQKDDYISEDCLYLNIFAPNISLSSGKSNNKKYPVMIIIGGSDFVEASGRETPGNILAAMGIIVISMNYRVGSLGFLTTGDEILPGNYGLWDQRQAIEFVRLNIAKFGGDVKNITLAGINTGAASAAIHMRNAQFAKHDVN